MTEQETQKTNFKVFDLYDISEVKVEDEGLKNVINLEPKLIIKSQGRNVQKFGQSKVNIIERLMNKISVAGHRGKKHRVQKKATGKYSKNMGIVLEAFKIIEEKTKKNPVEVLVRAIEKAAPCDEVTVVEYGGARYPQAAEVAPIRRVNLALKHIAHGASDKAFGKKKSFARALADEIMLAADGNQDSLAARKKNEAEKQADAAR